MRFAANLSFLFTEVPFLQRFALAKAHGFDAVEFFFPHGEKLEDIVIAQHESQTNIVLMNLPAGDAAAGDRGLACQPDRISEFRAAVGTGITFARALGCPRLHSVAGIVPKGADRARCLDTLVDNLQYACDAAARHGIDITLEPLNSRDNPGFVVNRSHEAMDVIERADRANLFLQYDVYHMQIMEGDLLPTMRKLKHRIGHIQFADTPGRHEPGTGEINYDTVFKAIDDMGYEGFVAAEYRPSGKSEESLAWFQRYRK
jgi:hydroxypyruvate isomerase